MCASKSINLITPLKNKRAHQAIALVFHPLVMRELSFLRHFYRQRRLQYHIFINMYESWWCTFPLGMFNNGLWINMGAKNSTDLLLNFVEFFVQYWK